MAHNRFSLTTVDERSSISDFKCTPSPGDNASTSMSSPRLGRASLPHHSLRRGTIQVARDMLVRRFTRAHEGRSSLMSKALTTADILEEIDKHINEINHLLSTYHQLLLSVGNPQTDSLHIRRELVNVRQHCLKTCDTTRNCIVPQLKSEPNGGASSVHQQHSSEFTKLANQFIGSLNLFVVDMKRCRVLLETFPTPSSSTDCATASGSVAECSTPQPRETPTRAPTSNHFTRQLSHRKGLKFNDPSPAEELANVTRDTTESEHILESVENAITVHFSTECLEGEVLSVPMPRRKGGRQLATAFCINCRTDYA